MVTEDIIIRIRAIDEATRVLSKVAGSVRQISSVAPQLAKGVDKLTIIKTFKPVAANANMLSGQLANLGIAANAAGISVKSFNKVLEKNGIQFVQGIGFIDKFSGKLMDTAKVTRMASIQAKRFRFEWLSIMFAGMALDRAFGGLLRTQMQLFGITDTLSAAWTTVLLPIMELISPIIFKLIEAFMNLPPGMQLAIGAFVVFGAILGKAMLIIGQVMLFAGGLKILFPAAFKAMSAGAGSFLVALGPILIVIGVIIALAVAIYLAWKSNFMNIRRNIQAFVDAFKQWFGGLISIVKGVLNIIRGIFTGDFELVKKGIIGIFKGIWNMVLGGWKMLINGIIILFKAGMKIVWNVIKVIVDAIIWIASKIKEFFGGKEIKFRMPSFQAGGLVQETGPALLHKGERVIPKSEVDRGNKNNIVFAPVTNIEAIVSSEIDIDRLAEEINRKLAPQFERVVGRGTV